MTDDEKRGAWAACLCAGVAGDAIDTLKISLWSAESADAHAVRAGAYLAAKDTISVRADTEPALALDPHPHRRGMC